MPERAGGGGRLRLRSGHAAKAAITQWRTVADQVRIKVPKLAALMDEAEHDVLAYPWDTSREERSTQARSGESPPFFVKGKTL